MKKFITFLLVSAMVFLFAACGQTETVSLIPGEDLHTLNEVFNNGYMDSSLTIGDNVYAQRVTNQKGEAYILIVKVPEELMDAFEAVDFQADDAHQQYLDLIGDIEFTDVCNETDFLPTQEELDAYKGMTIAEFEMGGAEITGYSGDNGDYVFFFDDDVCSYRVELEDGVKIEDYDDTDMFDAAIQDLKIGKVSCDGLTFIFMDRYVDQFLDAPEKAAPKELGEAKSSLDEINAAVGSNIKAVEGATDEKFSVIDGKIAQYIFSMNGYNFCVRSSADTNINLASDEFEEYPLVDEDGYITTVYSQNDFTQSLRFVFNEYQYAYIVYDNGEFDYMEWNALCEEYKNAICEYEEDSALKALLGNYSSEDGYAMSGAPVSEDTIQISAYTFDDTETKVWTMLVKENDGSLFYEKSRLEIYFRDGSESPAPSDAGSGVFTVEDGAIIWDNHIFN